MDILIVTAAREHWADWNARCRRDNVWFLGAQVVGFAGVVWQDPGIFHRVDDVDGEARPSLAVLGSCVSAIDSHAVELTLDDGALADAGIQVDGQVRLVGQAEGDESTCDTSVFRVQSVRGNTVTVTAASPERFHGRHLEAMPIAAEVTGTPLGRYLRMSFAQSSEQGLNSYAKMTEPGAAPLWARFWGAAAESDDGDDDGSRHDQEWYPLCSHLGGLAAQEAIKRGGRFVPRTGCYFADARELEDSHANGALPRALLRSQILVVGAGALGCETLKNAVQLRVGAVHVVDMDAIELSNLSRQFLFRPSDIGSSKALVAARRVQQQRPHGTRVTASHLAAGDDTAKSFAWDTYTAVIGAVDNLEARRWLDAMCAWHRIPFLDAGTLGVKANTQVVYPDHTQCYGDSRDPEPRAVPVCTIKQYPYQMEHCVHWALEQFAAVFGASEDDEGASEDDESDGEVVKARTLRRPPPGSVPESTHVLDWCASLLQRWFVDDIRTIRDAHPRDSRNDDGSPFWDGGKRRYPSSAQEWPTDSTAHGQLEELVALTARVFGDGCSVTFEKDDDANGHVAWLSHAASLRAQCYGIPSCDFATCKRIAGNIIPAVSSTTAMVVGLLMDELCKVTLGLPPATCYNAYVNLGINTVLFSEPMPPVVQRSRELDATLGAPVRVHPSAFTCWQRLTLTTDTEATEEDADVVADTSTFRTLREVKEVLEARHDASVTAMYGAAGRLLFSDVMHDAETLLDRPLATLDGVQVVRPRRATQVVVDLEDAEGTIVLMPPILVPYA